MIQICIKDEQGQSKDISLATLVYCITAEIMKNNQDDGEVSIAIRHLIREIVDAFLGWE